MKNIHRYLYFGLLCLGNERVFSEPGSLAGSRPNIIFVLTDDQGYGDLGCHGHPFLKTPNLDRLHSQSTRFTDFHVSPTCSPTRSALMTGRAPFKNGVTHTMLERERMTLSATTVADVLQADGYRTGIFGKWHLGDQEPYQPRNRGFDESFIFGSGYIGNMHEGSGSDLPENSYFDPIIRHNDMFVKTRGYCTDIFFRQALSWIKKCKDQGDKPFFAYLPTNVPHNPRNVEQHYIDAYDGLCSDTAAAFLGMVANMDENMGILMQKLDEWGLADNTLLIFMTDNGSDEATVYNYNMKGKKGSVNEGGTRVPFFMRLPGKIAAGVDVDRLTRHYDFFPTLVEITGATVPPEIDFDGRSLVPLINDPNSAWTDRYTFFHAGRWNKDVDPDTYKYNGFAVRDETWRLVNNALYNIELDPGEITNVAVANPTVVSNLLAAYDSWWDEARPLMVNEDASLDVPTVYPVEYVYQELTTGIPEWMPPTADWVLNGSFESGSDLWVLGDSASVSTNTAQAGSASLGVSGPGTATWQKVPLAPNRDYTLSGWIDSSGLSAGSITVDTSDLFDGPGQGEFVIAAANGGWTQYTGRFNSGTNTSVVLRISADGTMAGTVYVDNIVLEEEVSPFFTSTPTLNVDENSAYSYTVTAVDLNGDPVTFSGVTVPSWLTFNAETGVLNGTPLDKNIGYHPVVLQVSDGTNARVQHFTVRVASSGNNAPVVITYPDTGINAYNNYYYIISADDVDGDSLSYIGTTVPAWLTFSTETGALAGSPTSADAGLNHVVLSVSDGDETVDQAFDIMVFGVDDPVTNLVRNGSFETGGTAPTYWSLASPLNTSGSTNRATDGIISLKLSIEGPAKINAASQTVPTVVGVEYQLSVYVHTEGVVSGSAVFDTQDRYDGTCQFVFSSAKSGWGLYKGRFLSTSTSVPIRMFATTSFNGTVYFDNIVLQPVADITNKPPVITSAPVTNAIQNAAYTYILNAADAEDDALAFTNAVTLPSWLSFNADTGVLSGIPSATGDYSVTLRVSDGTHTEDQNFSVKVNSGYNAWAVTRSVTGSPTEDDDADGRDNFSEYVFNGDPKNGLDTGTEPAFIKAGDTFKYTYLYRNDNSNLVYLVQSTTNLISGVWTNAGISTVTNVTGAVYDEVTNSVPAGESHLYLRLRIFGP